MSRINYCHACESLAAGVKSRIALKHTCGRTPKEIAEFIDNANKLKSIKSHLFPKIIEKGTIQNENGENIRVFNMEYNGEIENSFINKSNFDKGGEITGGNDEEYRVNVLGEWDAKMRNAFDGYVRDNKEAIDKAIKENPPNPDIYKDFDSQINFDH